MTANMNFGPKWMRGGEDTLNSFKSPLEETNEFKYSKEFMLSLYQPYQIPDRFERHEHITVEESVRPKSFEPPSEAEKKILAGPVHSNSSRRNITAAEKSQNQSRNDLSGSPMNSPSSENTPTTPGRMARKGRSSDYFAKDQTFKRVDSDHLRRRDPNDATLPSLRPDENDSFGWQKPATAATAASTGSGFSSLFQSNDSSSGGSSSSSSLFNRPAVFGGDIGGSMFGNNPSSFMASLTAPKKPEECKWFYRDPSGQVQGPFEATEMQDWFVAGFFSNSLMVRRDDETVFEPLAMLIKKVGSEREPFMTAFPSSSSTSEFSRPSDLFSSPTIESPSNHLFRSSATSGLGDNAKYMPFSGSGVSNGGGNAPTTPLFQSSYGNYGGGGSGSSLLRDGSNPWSDSQQQQPQQQQPQQQKPSWLNPSSGSTSDLFGSAGTPLSINPLGGGGGGASSMSPMFGGAGVGGVGMVGGMSSPGLFDYQRMANDQMDQHQQYLQMLQQKQQQQSMQYQQHIQAMQQQQQQQQQFQQQQQQQYQQQQMQQQQMPPQPMQSFQQQQSLQSPQQSMQQPQADEVEQESSVSNNNNPLSQNPLKNLTLDLGGSNHASPVLRSNVLNTGGWGSIPGTPIGNDSPSSPWGSIVSTAIPTKISEELQAKAPGAQSPRAPSSPKKPIERTLIKTKPVEEALAHLQLEQEEHIEKPMKKESPVVSEKPKPTPPVAQVTPPPKPAAPKPIVSLREIQEEEMRKAEEKRQKQPKAPATTSWGPTPSASPSVSSTNTGSWSQPASSQKPLSLREIQEMEAKEAAATKRDSPSAAEYLTAAQNTTPSNLSWGVVVPNSGTKAQAQSAAAAAAAAAPWSAPTAPKKTLREIQLEEEAAMKKKSTKAAKATAYTTAAATPPPKTYSVSSSVNDGSWTTVSSVRAPKPVVPVTPPPVRYEPVQQKPIQRTPARVERGGPSEEFRRWCKQSLRGLNSGVNGEEILSMLLSFPLDAGSAEIIEDVIYANSESINGKRFAEEFMKLRRADIAGKLDAAIAVMEKEDDFKVVTKKGKKKNP
ncbi:hypothetical protein K501DRAFT_284731 [Backusella circina FSU 941]|nr:hypothetical protein K501DRAFT_284731 [Backusella circina FSU 941]